MNHFSAYIFDMDGTLLNNMGFHGLAWIEFLHRHGKTITEQEFRQQAIGHTNAEILRLFLGEAFDPSRVAEMGAEKEALYREIIEPHIQPVNGLYKLLVRLNQAERLLGLATSAPYSNIEFHLRALGLHGTFNTIVGEEDVRHGKPAPDLFLAAAERLLIPPRDVLVFEDSPIGLEAARRAGMPAVALTTTHPRQFLESIPGVVAVIDDFTQVPAQLLP